MDEINIKKTIFTPDIFLSKEDNFFLISGKSVTENAEELYNPVLKWFKKYFDNPNETTEIILYIEYLNSASSLQIGILFDIITKNKNKTKLIINWLYEEGDELSEDTGKEFQYIYEFKFNFIEIYEDNSEVFIF